MARQEMQKALWHRTRFGSSADIQSTAIQAHSGLKTFNSSVQPIAGLRERLGVGLAAAVSGRLPREAAELSTTGDAREVALKRNLELAAVSVVERMYRLVACTQHTQ